MDMCAIAGFADLAVTEVTIARMRSTMERRGPDGWGIHSDPQCTLLHARLAIIDPAGGRQPMHLRWGTEDFVLVYNGELYNTDEIRSELITCGHTFTGHSDTEVVLHAYAQWGEACTVRFNGIFAFAVWEPCRKRLFLARDRIGVKPLFYTMCKNGILFASEIKTILACPDVKRILNPEGASQLLLLGPGRVPGSCAFQGILELEPGEYAVYEKGHIRKYRYWRLTDREHTDTFEKTAEQVRSLVVDAITRQMVSDVPIGAFLSGGLDSSIICAVCAEEMKREGKQLDTFSVDYKDNARYFQPGKFQPSADSEYILRMQQYIGSRHHFTELTPENLSDALEPATCARDLPGMADVDFSLLAFCRQIRSHVKVGLSGECADEIFGGYPWYRDPEVRQREGFPWSQTTQQRMALLSHKLLGRIRPLQYIMDLYSQTIRESDILPGTKPTERRMKEMVNLNFRWFMQTLLDRKDRMSMYYGLEVRVPFCDFRIAEYLYGVPWEFKDYLGREKGLLRYAVRDLLPEQILHRKKSPYPKTFDPEYTRLMTRRLSDILADPTAPLLELIDRKALLEFLDHDSAWPWYGQLMRKPQTIAYFIQLEYWLEHYQVDIRI